MGNVLAASQASGIGLSPPGSMPPPPPPTVGVFPPVTKPESPDIKTPGTGDGDNGVTNPGSMEDLHKKCKGKVSICQPNVGYIFATMYTFHRFRMLSSYCFP